MEYYLHSVDMPFSGIKIKYRELNNKQFLALSKANLILPLDPDSALDYADILREITLECVKSKEDFLKLNLIDYFLFLAKLREVTLGEDLDLFLENDGEVNIKFTLNVSSFIEKLYTAAKESLEEKILNYDSLIIELDWPNLKCENLLLNPSLNTIDKITNFSYLFIKKINFGESKVIEFSNLSQAEQETIYNNLPYIVRQNIQSKVIDANTKLKAANIWNIKNVEGVMAGLDLFNISYQNILRLFFNININQILEEYYVLASKNILPSYLDTISLSERKLYVDFLTKEIEASQQSENRDNSFEQL